MQFSPVAADAFQTLQLNAGVIVDDFSPATGVVGNILGATTGGISFATNPTYEDFGADIDNCPENTMQLKRIVSYDPVLSGTFLTVTPALAKRLIGGADISTTHITPRQSISAADFNDVWFVGDYSDNNDGASTAGYVAIHLMNAFSTDGMQMQTTKDGKGQFAFTFHGHYDINSMSVVPFEIYIKQGVTPATPSVQLNAHSFTIPVSGTQQLTAVVSPVGSTITWSSSATAKASVSNGLVTGVAAGTAIITAAITVNSVTYNDTCTVVVS